MNLSQLQDTLNSWEIHAPLQQIEAPMLEQKQVTLYIKREDLIHPHVSGNKWRKLKYNLIQAKTLGHDTLLTFGGAYSNHILATAAAGKLFGFRTIGIIRGEAYSPLNPILSAASHYGMSLHYLSRSSYRHKDEGHIQQTLKQKYGDFYLIPEGGTNSYALKGCQEILNDIAMSFDVICCACATGGTLAGLVTGIDEEQIALGISVLKGESFLADRVHSLLAKDGYQRENWSIQFSYHWGGFAKNSPKLLEFMDWFAQSQQIQLERIYTGKLMYGIFDLIQRGYFKRRSTVVALHTGNYPTEAVR